MSVALFLGILANIIFIVSGLFRLPKHAIALAICGNITYIIYYSVIGLYAPIVNVAIGAVSGYLIIRATRPEWVKYIAVASAVIISGLILENLDVWQDILLLAAAWCICAANVNKESYIFYKIFVVASQCLWIIYCLQMHEYAMLTTCIFIMASNVSSLIYNMRKDRTLLMQTVKAA